MYFKGLRLLQVLIVSFIFFACKKNEIPIGLNNKTRFEIRIDSIKQNSVIVIASVNRNEIPVLEYGFCLDTTPLNLNKRIALNFSEGTFYTRYDSLKPGKKYYVKTYLASPEFTLYSNDTAFFTLPPVLPEIESVTATFISTDIIKMGGKVKYGGGLEILEKGICWNTTGNPDISDHYLISAGAGQEYSVEISGLNSYTTYYLRAYAENSVGIAYGEVFKYITYGGKSAYSEKGTVTDIEGNIYGTVKIGNQWWMSENLKTTKYNDGTSIPKVEDGAVWVNTIFPAYSILQAEPGYSFIGEVQGLLYNRLTIKNNKNICPSGWRIPTYETWDSLLVYIDNNTFSNTAPGKMLSSGHWSKPTTNESGFSAVRSGRRQGYFKGLYEDVSAWFMSSTIQL